MESETYTTQSHSVTVPPINVVNKLQGTPRWLQHFATADPLWQIGLIASHCMDTDGY